MNSELSHELDHSDDLHDLSLHQSEPSSSGQSKRRSKKRPNHNELERKRRAAQKDKLMELKSVLPMVTDKPSTVTVITKATEYIGILQRRIEELEQENMQLRQATNNGSIPAPVPMPAMLSQMISANSPGTVQHAPQMQPALPYQMAHHFPHPGFQQFAYPAIQSQLQHFQQHLQQLQQTQHQQQQQQQHPQQQHPSNQPSPSFGVPNPVQPNMPTPQNEQMPKQTANAAEPQPQTIRHTHSIDGSSSHPEESRDEASSGAAKPRNDSGTEEHGDQGNETAIEGQVREGEDSNVFRKRKSLIDNDFESVKQQYYRRESLLFHIQQQAGAAAAAAQNQMHSHGQVQPNSDSSSNASPSAKPPHQQNQLPGIPEQHPSSGAVGGMVGWNGNVGVSWEQNSQT
ncbi:hypothetical protein BKA69DRAFT_1121276 [Paraphysoderma sedebokerense]|nr:hypothetical protein BKA69DRAFT_1121276 [Paraphysoderma sedebokerense]